MRACMQQLLSSFGKLGSYVELPSCVVLPVMLHAMFVEPLLRVSRIGLRGRIWLVLILQLSQHLAVMLTGLQLHFITPFEV